MNLLYLAHRIPYPPDKGDKIRSFHQIRRLSREHSVHLACLVDDERDLRHVDAIGEFCRSVSTVFRHRSAARLIALGAVPGRRSLSVAAFHSKALQERIRGIVRDEKLDAILGFSSVMAAYVEEVSSIPRIMDFVDVDSEKWRAYATYHRPPASWIFALEARRLARFEESVLRTFDRAIVVSEAEAELLRRRVPDRPVSVIPNGVDLEYLAPVAERGLDLGEHALVFTGAMDYFANVDGVEFFCDEVFPAVRAELPGATFHIVGRDPTRRVRKLAARPNVAVTGYVPDVRPYLWGASVAVAPLRIARGVQNKVLEAMAAGLPVVGTPNSFQGIRATDADGVRVAADPGRFAAEVISLLRDPGLRIRCATAARDYVRRNHQWEDQARRLEELLRTVVEEAACRRA